MSKFGTKNLSDKEKEFYKKEILQAKERLKSVSKYITPDFSLGLEYLGINIVKNKKELRKRIFRFVDSWFKAPQKIFFSRKKPKVIEKDGFLTFPSLLSNSQKAVFKYDPNPPKTLGHKVAMIYIMQWNARVKNYEKINTIIRDIGLPVSTLIFVPTGRGLNPGEDCPADFESVSPNLGKSVFKTIQYVRDIQYMVKFLKEKKGYKEVGLFTYSIGSMHGIISAVTSKNIFDFGIFHLVADDFCEAVMKGVCTQNIAKKIDKKIDKKIFQKIWSIISPGAYDKYLLNLPKHTRIVQSDYDFVFGRENSKRFIEKAKKYKPNIDIDIVPTTHEGIANFPINLEVIWRDLEFIYKNTMMKKDKRSLIFKKYF